METPDFHRNVERLFHEALDLEPGERIEFLNVACENDEQLRVEVSRLIEAATTAQADSLWSHSALEIEALQLVSEVDSSVPDRYRLLDRIGAGGMGAVYKAVRADDEYSKLVAVKIVQTSDPHMIERFRQERQILAQLEHPNIARLLDGGSTSDGRPFLAMEFVADGVSIAEFTRTKNLEVREILVLFRKVCSAVAYAHRNLVVHRDLKPANILVTVDGEPKLLDFGIARLIGSEAFTQTGPGTMTPNYASPEQVSGRPVTTASDVYSLGVVLFELLAKQRPYRPVANPLELAQAILTDPPLSLGPAFDADLDNIVQMALRKEPERRYASVDQFSEDLQRYLDGYPVMARPDSTAYRARKFVKRNRVVVAAAVLVFLSMAGGIAATAVEAHRANQRFDDVRSLAHAVVFDYHDAIEALPGSTKIRERLAKDGLVYLNKLAETGGDEALRRELSESYVRIGDVQGYPYTSNLGDPKGALESVNKGVALAERLVHDRASKENSTALAEAYKSRAGIRETLGDLAGAKSDYGKGADTFEAVLKLAPADDVNIRVEAIDNYNHLGQMSGAEGTSHIGGEKDVMAPYRRALAIAEALVAAKPADQKAAKALYSTQLGIALTERGLGRFEEAEEANRKCLDTISGIAKANPNNVFDQLDWAVAHGRLAQSLMDDGKSREAIPVAQNAIRIVEKIVAADPSSTTYFRGLQIAVGMLGLVYLRAGEAAEALPVLDRSLELTRQWGTRVKDDSLVTPDLALAHIRMTEAYSTMGRFPAATEYGKQAETILGKVNLKSQDAYIRGVAIVVHARLGDTYRKMGACPQAMAEYQSAEKTASVEIAANPQRPTARSEMAQVKSGEAACEVKSGQPDTARVNYRESVEIWKTLEREGKLLPRLRGVVADTENDWKRLH